MHSFLFKEDKTMIGMSFNSFLTLLVISGIAAFIVHYVARYRMVSGAEGFFGKWILGWLGGWLGSPVLGHWSETLKYEGIYFVPAFLGSLAAVFGTVLFFKTVSKMFPAALPSKPSVEPAKGREAA
jgi:uncharacterized membrane protein YeaQ/YmgE (transglycosylase-associated protein family)